MSWENDWDVSDIKHITVYESPHVSFSRVLDVFGEPYVLTKPKNPMGFDLTKRPTTNK